MHFFAYHVLLCVLVGLTETIRFARSADSPPPTLPQPYRYRAPAKQEVGHLLSPSQYGGSRTSLSSITIANKVPFFKDDAAIPGHEQVRFVYFNILPSTKRVILQVMTQSTGSPIVGLYGTAIPRRYHSYLLPNFGQVIDRASFNVAMELFGRMLGFGGGLEEQYGSAEFGCYAWYAVEYAKLFSTETSRVYYIEATVEPSSELRVTYYSNEDTPGLTTFFRLYQPTDEEYKYRELIHYNGAFAESINWVLQEEGDLIARQEKEISRVSLDQRLYHEYAKAVGEWGSRYAQRNPPRVSLTSELVQDRVKSDSWQVHLEQLRVGVKGFTTQPDQANHVLFFLPPRADGDFVASVVVPMSMTAANMRLIIGVCHPQPDDGFAISRLIGITTDATTRAAMAEDIKEGSFYQNVFRSMKQDARKSEESDYRKVFPTNYKALRQVPAEMLEKTAPDGVFMYGDLRQSTVFTFELLPQDLEPVYDERDREKVIGWTLELRWYPTNQPKGMGPGQKSKFEVYIFSREDRQPILQIGNGSPTRAGPSGGPKAFAIVPQAEAKSINVPEPGDRPILDTSKFRQAFPPYYRETESQRFWDTLRRQSEAGPSSSGGVQGRGQEQEQGQEQSSSAGGQQSGTGAGRRWKNTFKNPFRRVWKRATGCWRCQGQGQSQSQGQN